MCDSCTVLLKLCRTAWLFTVVSKPWMKASGTDFSSRQTAPRWVPCSQSSKCTAELSAGCRKPPWKERTAWRNASGPAPSKACRTRWGRRMSASWHTWCSTPEENTRQNTLNQSSCVHFRPMDLLLFLWYTIQFFPDFNRFFWIETSLRRWTQTQELLCLNLICSDDFMHVWVLDSPEHLRIKMKTACSEWFEF